MARAIQISTAGRPRRPMTSRADGKLPLPAIRSMARAGAVLLFAAAVGLAESATATSAGGGGGQLAQTAVAAPAQSRHGNLDNLADFLDPLFARHLDEHHIPGAVIAVVQGGEIVYRKGYGYADVERRVPVDPNATLFNIGSVTKLFTATAVMQLAERGAVDLHADVNEYLSKLQVPATFDEPVTLHHLLTHTAGFDERFIGMTAPTLEAVEPLGAHLARHLPPRIRPPGQAVQYSNHGIALAGHVVEAVSGMDFADYVGEHILGPLDMERSTLGFPPELVPDMATGYGYSGEAPRPQHPNYFNILPAGGMRSTAADMSVFMLAHLGAGEHQGRRIVETATARNMHERQFTAHPAVSGAAYGFFEHVAGERRGLHHSGDDPEGFATLLYLLPQAELGLFVSYNSAWGALARIELIEAFLDPT